MYELQNSLAFEFRTNLQIQSQMAVYTLEWCKFSLQTWLSKCARPFYHHGAPQAVQIDRLDTRTWSKRAFQEKTNWTYVSFMHTASIVERQTNLGIFENKSSACHPYALSLLLSVEEAGKSWREIYVACNYFKFLASYQIIAAPIKMLKHRLYGWLIGSRPLTSWYAYNYSRMYTERSAQRL